MGKKAIKMTVLTIGLASMLGFSQGAYANTANVHIIQKGDTLYNIAKRYNTTVTALREFNNLGSNLIIAGKTLKIGTIITVKKGDTLYNIARSNGMSVSELKKINNLKTDRITPGQKLFLTKAAKPAGSSYDASKAAVSLKVKSGYSFGKEEPGKYILQYKKDGTYFARIEVLDAKANISAVKKNAAEYLKSTGKVIEIKNQNYHPFYRNAEFYLHASGSKASQNVVVKRVNGKLVKFTIHFANKEESEGITPYIIEMLQTTTVK
ncbi:LysM peptidoglycan-binding domain-containing protein [Bacillus sp. M6-12]|uniref:LysM peptidoglycan-binding domain-containing protein n=1 Tax=Bacillus sp. M6-12 TaxID=2054166 RepID=UPI0015E12351|nr:LysM peptidoglycan-binding domain-containing protein [Bacillus sp. M6-12]